MEHSGSSADAAYTVSMKTDRCLLVNATKITTQNWGRKKTWLFCIQRAQLKGRILFIKLIGSSLWNISLGLKFASSLGKHPSSSGFRRRYTIPISLCWHCWGSVQMGGLIPFHGLPSPFRREMSSPKQSTKDLQGAGYSHRLIECLKLEGTCKYHWAQQLLKELDGTHIPEQPLLESGCDLVWAYLQRWCGKSCTGSRSISRNTWPH